MANRRDYSRVLSGYGSYFVNGDLISQPSYGTCVSNTRTATDYSRRHKPVGWKPPTSYSLVESAWRRANGTCDIFGTDGTRYTYTGWQDWNPNGYYQDLAAVGIPWSYPGDLSDRAIRKLRANIKASNFNAAQALGERRETARFVGDTLSRIAKAAMDIKHGHFRRGLKRLGDSGGAARSLSDAVLAFQYGVKPLCSDIYGAVNELDNLDRGAQGIVVKATVTDRYNAHGVFGATPNAGRDSRLMSGTVTYGSYCRADLIPANGALIKASQLGLTNPVSLAWELLPFSFVLDWAWPLGDYFSQFDALLGWEVRGYSQSAFTKFDLSWTGMSGVGSSGARYNNSWNALFRYVVVTRDVASSIPFAAFPALKDPFSKTHVLNGLALLSSVFRGIR